MKNTAIILMLMAIFSTGSLQAQKYITKNGKISFFSDAPMEKIEAHNNQVNAALDLATGDLVFKVLMKSFEFEKALMQEHFNENYVESDKFPNATFAGKIINIADLSLPEDGTYEAIIHGKLTIHGVTKDIQESGELKVSGSKISGKTKFSILLADYDIKIPNTVVNNISETIEITVDVDLEELNK